MATVYTRKDGCIGYVVLNKAERRNAIDPDMMDVMTDCFNSLEADTDVKVVILSAEGDHFCSGGDLKAAPGGHTIESSHHALRKYGKTVMTIQNMEKPVIAAVKGYAVGGGMSLALACDIIFAAESAKFSCNFLKVGICPEMGAMMFMPQLIGMQRSKELWYTGRIVSGEEAYVMGFVNKVVPDPELEKETLGFANGIATVPSMSLAITKRIANSTYHRDLVNILDTETLSTPFCSQTKEHKALVEAFLNRKK
ncbi:MAG: enoyl-CoA hydratase/isomerase family protein [Deferribacterales bacterium]